MTKTSQVTNSGGGKLSGPPGPKCPVSLTLKPKVQPTVPLSGLSALSAFQPRGWVLSCTVEG